MEITSGRECLQVAVEATQEFIDGNDVLVNSKSVQADMRKVAAAISDVLERFGLRNVNALVSLDAHPDTTTS